MDAIDPPDLDSPSSQIHLEIRDAVVRAFATHRPILHHLNADTSWLLQIPRPANAVKHGSRIYFNVLIDPWFVGGQSDVAKWFSQQWHATKSAVQSVRDVDELARQVEVLAGGSRFGTAKGKGKGKGKRKREDEDEQREEETLVDVVAISHEFTDHCHKNTLLEVHPNVPVFATEQAAKLISSWSHFRTVITTPTFPSNADWHDYSLLPLPSWLSISRLTSQKDALFFHSALLITFSTHPFLPPTPKKRSSLLIHGDDASSPSSSQTSEAAECIVYTPHGIPHAALSPIATADPPLHTLAFLHGLHDVSISAAQQLNLGAKNGVLAQKILGAKYWVATHDEVKKGGGIVAWFLKRRVWTLDDALREVMRDEGGEEEFLDVRFQQVGNGESRVLE